MDRKASVFLLSLLILINITNSAFGAGQVENMHARLSFITEGNHAHQRDSELPPDQTENKCAPRSQEESEDDDDSANEKLFHRVSLTNLTHFLDLLYARQHSLFHQLHREIETPPPRIS